MYQVSNAFESAMRYGKKELRVLCDGEPLSPFSVDYTVSGGELQIGAVSTASVVFKSFGRLNVTGKPLTVDIGVDTGEEINYIPLGQFVIAESKAGDETTTITAYDAAYYAMGGEYVPSASNPPTTALAVLRDVCQQCGIGFALDGSAPIVGTAIVGRAVLGDVDIADQPVSGDLTGHTCREMAGYMAALLGCNAVINRNGDLALRWFSDAGQQITPDNYYSGGLKLEGETTLAGLSVTRTVKVRTENEDGTVEETDQTETYTAGDGSGTVIAIDNPYATQEIVNAVWSRLSGLSGLSGYRWGSVELFGGVLIEPGDIVTVTDLQGNVSKVPVMGLTLYLDGGCKATITAGGRTETEVTANVQGPMGKALSKVQADIGEFKNLTAENFRATSAYIGKLVADEAEIRSAKIGELSADVGNFKDLTAQNFEATNTRVGTIEGDVGDFKTLTADRFQANEVLIGNAQSTADNAQSAADNAQTAADAAKTTATTAKSTADAAKSTADDAQSTADAAKTAATNAQTAANSKNAVFYQTTQPATTGRKTGDVWFDTGNGNAMYAWNGSEWVQHQFGTVAIKDGAVTADKLTAWDVIAQNVLAQDITATGTIKAKKLQVDGDSLIGVFRFGSYDKYTNRDALVTTYTDNDMIFDAGFTPMTIYFHEQSSDGDTESAHLDAAGLAVDRILSGDGIISSIGLEFDHYHQPRLRLTYESGGEETNCTLSASGLSFNGASIDNGNLSVSGAVTASNLTPSAYRSIANNATATFEFNNNMGVLYVARGSSNAMYIFDYWTARSAPSSGSVASGVTVNKAMNSKSVTIKNTSGGAIALMGLNGTFK